MHKALVDHIRERLDGGQDIRLIHDHLVSRGFASHEVHEAIDHVYRELHHLGSGLRRMEKDSAVKDVEAFYYPSRGKLVIPFVIFCLLTVHFFININSFPGVGQRLCEMVREPSVGSPFIEIPAPEQLQAAGRLDLSTVQEMDLLLVANYPLIATRAYALSPLFPLPCELAGLASSKGCRYYIAEEDYECVARGVSEQPGSGVAGFFGGALPPYRPISLSAILMSSVILLLVGYVLNCVLVYGYQEVRHEKGKRLIEWAIAAGLMIFMVALVFGYLYILRILTR